PNPSGFANAVPNGVCNGESVLITCSTNTGCQSPTSALTVTADLTAANGPLSQPLYDDGTHGDATAGDGLFSVSFTPPSDVPAGSHTLHAIVTDDLGH